MDGTRSALIVASDEYSDPGLRCLRAPAVDARALAGVQAEVLDAGRREAGVPRRVQQPAHLQVVTDPEPLPADHPLWDLENVIIAPHYGGSHPGYEQHAGAVFVENLRRYVAGAPLTSVIDKEAGY